MPKNNLIADNFLIQFFAHVTLKYSAYVKESTLTVYKGNVCKNGGKKSKSDQANEDTFSQAHDSADSKLKVKHKFSGNMDKLSVLSTLKGNLLG